jgi:hypothetical protein
MPPFKFIKLPIIDFTTIASPAKQHLAILMLAMAFFNYHNWNVAAVWTTKKEDLYLPYPNITSLASILSLGVIF